MLSLKTSSYGLYDTPTTVWSKEVYHLRLRLQRPVERQPDPGRDRWQAGEEEEGLLWPTLRQALPRLRGRPEHARQGLT